MILQRKVAGVPGSERLAHADGARVAGRVAEAIHELHTRGVTPIRQHTIDDELQILRTRLHRMCERAGVERIERLLARCERLASELQPRRPQPIHRDFYPDHILIDGQRLWLIDLDLYCAGDPALDVGNFIAHMIEARVRRDRCADRLTEAEAAFETRYVELAGRHVLPAIRAYTTLSLVRHVQLSTEYPDRYHTTGALLELCEARLSAGLGSKLYA
jgi:aminoglycoside phosphotransferase (APT) family kinase protein